MGVGFGAEARLVGWTEATGAAAAEYRWSERVREAERPIESDRQRCLYERRKRCSRRAQYRKSVGKVEKVKRVFYRAAQPKRALL